MGGIAFKTLGGDGPDVVLIHGFGSDRLSWLGNSPALMAVARVHALDLPGHGESDMDVGGGTPDALARRVIQSFGTAGLDRIHIVAHSLGGAIGLLIAAAQPERVASLALIAPAGLGRGVDPGFLSAYPDLAGFDEAAALLRRLVSRAQLINKLTVQRALDQLNRDGARAALGLIARQLIAHEEELRSVAAKVAEANIPRLVLWGSADTINPPDAARIAGFGGSSAVVADTGHLPHIEAAKAINASLVQFLQGVSEG